MKETLFLMEQLIAVLVFAICASVCVRIFAYSYTISNSANDTNSAVIIAKSAAECYKAFSGDIQKTAQALDGKSADSGIVVYYDNNKRVCGEKEAEYVLLISKDGGAVSGNMPQTGSITVNGKSGNEILAFSVAAREW